MIKKFLLIISTYFIVLNIYGFHYSKNIKNNLHTKAIQDLGIHPKKRVSRNSNFSGIWTGKCDNEINNLILDINHNTDADYLTITEYPNGKTIDNEGIKKLYRIGEFTNKVQSINSKYGISSFTELKTTNWSPSGNKLIHAVTSVMGGHLFEDRDESSLELENNKLIYEANYYAKWGDGNDFVHQSHSYCVLNKVDARGYSTNF